MPSPKVVFIGEDHERMQVFLKALDARGVDTEVWNTGTSGALVSTLAPDLDCVYYCRQSPSAGTRAAPTAMAYAKEVVRWLEFHGAKVVNGVKALDAEASKSLQMMYLNAAGCNTPFTVLAQGRAQAATEAFRFVDAGVMVKPNTGGSGAGIDAFETGEEVPAALARAAHSAPDELWVLQSLLGVHTRDVTVMKSILRFEVVGGKVQRDYIVKITAPATEFKLCPCDPRGPQILSRVSFMILDNPLSIPGFRGDPPAFQEFCRKVEAAFVMVGATIGSVEAFVLTEEYPEQAARYPFPHEPVIFEMNFNSNYNELAEAAAGIVPGVERVCDVLCTRLGRP